MGIPRRTRRRVTVLIAVVVLLGAAGAASASDERATTSERAVRVDTPPRSLTVIAGGDVLPESRVRSAAASAGQQSGVRYDFGPMFAPVGDIVRRADLAICDMEIPVVDDPGSERAGDRNDRICTIRG